MDLRGCKWHPFAKSITTQSGDVMDGPARPMSGITAVHRPDHQASAVMVEIVKRQLDRTNYSPCDVGSNCRLAATRARKVRPQATALRFCQFCPQPIV